jgi:MYXO-CTERM domain-containing protein
LEEASALSLVHIELIPDALAQPISVAGWRPRGTLRDAAQTLVRALQFFVDALIWAVVFLLPVSVVILGLPLLALFWLIRRRRRREESPR